VKSIESVQEKQPVQAWLTQRGWLRRVLRLTGRVEATLEYDARSVGIGVRSREIVRVNGAEVWTERWGELFEKHSHTFLLPAKGQALPILIEVEFTPVSLVEVWKLRVLADDAVIYEEAWGRVRHGERLPHLPLPSARPPDSRGALPVVPHGEVPREDDLPIPSVPDPGGA